MSGRDPIAALMKKAGFKTKNVPTRHPEKAAIVAERFNRVAELLETGDVVAAGVAASQAQALYEVLHAMWKQDQVEELQDSKSDAKQDAERKWKWLLSPDDTQAQRLASHYRENRFNFFQTTPPYKAPPPAPREPRDGTRYVSVMEAADPQVAEELGLPVRYEFRHGVSKRRCFMLSLKDAIDRKMKPDTYREDGWSLNTLWRQPSGLDFEPGWTTMRFIKHEWNKRGCARRKHEVTYHLASTSHPHGMAMLEERDGKKSKAGTARKTAS